VTLTATCQALHTQIRMDDSSAKANLLTKTLCPGLGLAARMVDHCPCKTRGWHKSLGCGGDGYDAESRPCLKCGINTCDECRIHVIYQVYMQDPGLDNRRWWAGYLLTYFMPFALHPPIGDDGASWHLPVDLTKAHHDQGRFHVPLHIDAIADPEPIDRILDVNLGRHHITPAGRITAPFDGDQLVNFFNMAAESRRELVCVPCFEKHQTQGFAPCSCTFRKRMLDRWVCIPCYAKEKAEEDALAQRRVFHGKTSHILSRACRCGDKITPDDEYMAICNWCNGRVEYTNEDEVDDEDAKTFSNNDDDEDNAAPAPTDLPPDHIGLAHNKDGTVSAFFNGERISGERLGYETVVRYAVSKGADLGCACCTCPDRGCQHGHDHSDAEESGSDYGDADTEDDYTGVDFDEEEEPEYFEEQTDPEDFEEDG